MRNEKRARGAGGFNPPVRGDVNPSVRQQHLFDKQRQTKRRTRRILYALSLKQPWAALVVHGLKSIEVRQWPTPRRGTILIHASKTADERPQGWKDLPADVKTTAALRGGIIGMVELTECVAYRSRSAFAADRAKHWNLDAWFREPVLYGFVFTSARVLPFRRFPGWFKFFPVEMEDDLPVSRK